MPPGEGSWAGLHYLEGSYPLKKKKGKEKYGVMALFVSASIFITELQRVLQERIRFLF